MQSDGEVHPHAMNSINQRQLNSAIESHNWEAVSLLLENGVLVGEKLNSFLSKAINKNNHIILKKLIDHGIQYNQSIDFGNILNAAIFRGNSLMIEAIIPHCKFSQPSDQYIPRELVIKTDPQYKDCVELLLKWNFIIDPNSRDDESFIWAAVENGYSQIISQLLQYGIDVNMVNSETQLNILTTACLNKYHDFVKILLEYHADANVRIPITNTKLDNYLDSSKIEDDFNRLFSMDEHKYVLIDVTCLHIAVFNSDPLMMEMLLRHGAKIEDYTELFNLTSYAVRYNCEEVVRIFLDHDVKVTDINSNGKSLLDFCVYWDNHGIDYGYNNAKLLLEKGADIHLKIPNNELVSKAIDGQHRKTAQLFLNYDADVQYIDEWSGTLLHKAFKYNFDLEFIETLLKLHPPINTKDRDGDTPLFDAFKRKSKNQLGIIKAILYHGADIYCTDRYLRTPLHLACDDFYLELVTVFLERGINPNVRDGGGKTPLHYICKRNSDVTASIIKLLLEYGADIEAVDNSGWTPLFVACEASNDATVKCLLDNRANPHITVDKGQTPLHVTCYHDNDMTGRVIELLLGCGLNIEATNEAGYTPLFKACLMHGQNAVECLLDNNANPNAKDCEGRTPLHNACKRKGDKTDRIIKLLLQHGANIDAVDPRGWTPLFFACDQGDDAAVKCLLDNHANPHNIDVENTILLHIAIKNFESNYKIVDMLLNYNVNVHSIDNHGRSVIHYIAKRKYTGYFDETEKYVELLKRFASVGINLNSLDNKGYTPLHIAVKRLSKTMTGSLIKYGSDINILSRHNKTPLEKGMEIVCPQDNFYNSINLRRSKREIMVMLKRQVIKLKVAGLKVHDQNLDIIYDTDDDKVTPQIDPYDEDITFDVEQLEVECKREIEMMKSHSIGIDNFTLYDLLTNHVYSPCIRSEIRTIQRKVERKVNEKKFGLYIDIIRSRVREASIRCKRRKLMDSARNDFILKISRRLPDECIDMVLDYLNIEEVERFVETMKSLKVTQPQRKSTRKRKLTSL